MHKDLSKNIKVKKQERRREELFPEVRIHHRESYVSVEEAPTSRVSFNRFSRSTLDFFPCGGEIDLHRLSRGSPQARELTGDT